MGSGTSSLVDGGELHLEQNARLEANSKALWGQLIKHAIENRENESNNMLPSHTECKACTYLNPPSISVCEVCGENVGEVGTTKFDGVKKFPSVKLITRTDTMLVLTVEHCNSVQYRPVGNVAATEWSSSPVNHKKVELMGLVPDTLYEIRCCVEDKPIGPASRIRSGPSICGPPSPPSASEVGDSFIMINWEPPAIMNGLPVDGYIAEVKLFGGKFERCYEGKERIFVARSLSPQKMYVFRVAAVNTLGQSPWSKSSAFRTTAQEEGVEEGGSPTAWLTSITVDGRCFYYHPVTDHSCWTLPQGAVLDQESLFRRKREQFLQDVSTQHALALSQPEQQQQEPEYRDFEPSFTRISVRRRDIVNSSYHAFKKLSHRDLLRPLRVTYHGEAGIDAGGLVKDWFLEMSHALIEGEFGFFTALAEEKDVFRIDSRSKFIHDAEHLEGYYEFIGTFLAKAVLDHHTVDVRFDRTLLLQLLRIPATLEDIKNIDPHHYKGLVWILENDVRGVLDEETFSITLDVMGEKKEVELKSGGCNIALTNDNKEEYVKLMVFHLVAGSCLPQLEALVHGFHKLIPLKLLISHQITPEDLQTILLGKEKFDVDEIEAVARYNGGYDRTSQPVVWFWEAFKSFAPGEQHALLRFITGLHKVPLDGFDPLFTITCGEGETSCQALPRSHTCFNQLVLPPYDSYSTLVSKLKYAIENTPTEFIMT